MTRANKDYDWAFDLRAFNYESFSDDSGDDSQPPGSNKKRHGVRLEDFDLGSREESVSYKPNPFSIAKINAAYRSARNGGGEAKIKSSLPQNCLPDKACGLVQTKIDDVLKIQKSKSLKRAVATKDSRPPGASYANSETTTARIKQPRPKIGPTGRDFDPQSVHDSNANPNEESSNVRSGFDPTLEPALLSANAHILTLAPTEVPSRLNDEPACMIPSPEYVKPDPISPFRNYSLFSSPLRPTVSKLEATSIFPKHESPPLALSSRHIPRSVDLRPVDPLAVSNSDQVDQKCFADQQEFCFPSEISASGRTEARTDLSRHRASAPFLPNPGNRAGRYLPPGMTTGRFRKPAALPMVHSPKRQAVAQSVTTPVVPLKRSVGDAYSLYAEDPDENWCTLPTRKKQMLKNSPASSFGVPKSFRLPGLLPPRNTVKIENDTTSGKRIMTYLPPPRMPHASADELTYPAVSRRSYPIPQVQDEKKPPALPSSPGAATSYPSPSHPRISRPYQVYPVGQATPIDGVSEAVLAIREQIIGVYRPPSPPTSDPPFMSSDLRIQFDLRVVRDNRPRPKGTSHKVFPLHFLSIRFGGLCLLSCSDEPYERVGSVGRRV